MSRVIPFKNPTWDYSLWEKIRGNALLISDVEKEYISTRERGGSGESVFWRKGGRANTNQELSQMNRDDFSGNINNPVYDFIGLSKSFDRWFGMVEMNPSGLLDEIRREAEISRNDFDFKDFDDQWLDINWSVLGRAVGSAIANEGKRQRFWTSSGADARMANDFWMRIHEEMDKDISGRSYVTNDEWNEIQTFFRERDFDPSAEIVRSAGHMPSAPIFKGGSYDGAVYSVSTLVASHRQRMRSRFRNSDDAEEFALFHGELTFKAVRDAMDALNDGKYGRFALMINGLCANHMMRTSVTQQKIGMHLLSNLAVRKMTRGVDAMPVPDIAQQLSTGFPMGKILQIMHDAGIIEWYTVDVSLVEEAIGQLKVI